MDVIMKELFTTDIGLLVVFTIGFLIAMACFCWQSSGKRPTNKRRNRAAGGVRPVQPSGGPNSPCNWARLAA